MEQEKEEAKKKNKDSTSAIFYVVLLLSVLLIFFFIGRTLNSKDLIKETIEKGETENSYIYNGFVFFYQDNLWNTRWQRDDVEYSIHFHFGPREAQGVPVYGGLKPNLNTSKFYITFDPEDKNLSMVSLAANELALSLTKVFNVKIEPACTVNKTDACVSRPIITCNNTKEAVLYLKTESPAMVDIEDNCITIQGEGYDIVKAADKMLFNLYGIVPHTK